VEQVALRIQPTGSWTYLGHAPDPAKPVEVVIRAFDGAALAATGTGPHQPDGTPIEVPEGEGRRLEGTHFFARPAGDGGPCLLSYRGI
jgi:hypothetical protein